MKKMVLTFIFSLIFLPCIAPILNYIAIPVSEPVYIYGMTDPVLRAFASYESKFDPNAVNKHSKARGLMQVTKPMIREVNRIIKIINWNWSPYTWEDAWDPKKSIDMWYIKQNYSNPDYDLEKACKLWFGTGTQKHDSMTWRDYLKEIEERL